MSISTRFLFGRREFLVSTGASVLATAALGPQLFASTATSEPVKRLAVGFAHQAEAFLTDAKSLPAGDGRFIGSGARIAVSGSSGMSGGSTQRRVTQLLTHFSYFEGGDLLSAPFSAWSANRGGQGNPIRFPVPLDLTQKLSFTVVVESGESAPAPTSRRRAARGAVGTPSAGRGELPLILSVQNDPEAFPLLRGYYVVVPLFASEGAPDWSRYRLFQVGGRWTLLDVSGAPAPFEHFVLKVAYETS